MMTGIRWNAQRVDILTKIFRMKEAKVDRGHDEWYKFVEKLKKHYPKVVHDLLWHPVKREKFVKKGGKKILRDSG